MKSQNFPAKDAQKVSIFFFVGCVGGVCAQNKKQRS